MERTTLEWPRMVSGRVIDRGRTLGAALRSREKGESQDETDSRCRKGCLYPKALILAS